MKNNLSVYIIAHNEIQKIEQAITSVIWADEVVLVDSYSTDGTAEKAEELGAKVIQVPFSGFGALRNAAIKSCKHEWILSIDADERCTKKVRAEILAILNGASTKDVYFIPRRNFLMGRWIRFSGWYPDYRQPQLFRRGSMEYDTLPVHEGYILKSSTPPGYLRNPIWQIPFGDPSEFLRKAQKYSDLGATKLAGRRPTFVGAFGHALWAFIKTFFLKLGFLDGWRGFLIGFSGFEATYYKHIKALAIQRKSEWRSDFPDPVR